jgi:hypothetical protein
MNVSKRLKIGLLSVVIAIGGLALGERFDIPGLDGFVSPAKATVGRPLTPVSVAGVSRRTNRRN